MNKNTPNKWLKKAVFDAINNITVLNELTSQNVSVPCYGNRVPADNTSQFYTLITTTTNQQETTNKCESYWISSVLVDIVTIYNGSGNTGSDLMCDNITNAVSTALDGLTLDVVSGLKITVQNVVGLDSLNNITATQNVYRNLYRLQFIIN